MINKKTKIQEFGTIAFIFGTVIFLLSGFCTLGFEASLILNPPTDPYDQAWLTFWNIIGFGAAGFVPAGLLALMGQYTKRHGNKMWILIAMGLIMALFIYFIGGFIYYSYN